uniref:ABC transporter domain-containing protein n=1 Tax=Tetranychus urticae TaxID=32264 RepID=T1L148_TETUR
MIKYYQNPPISRVIGTNDLPGWKMPSINDNEIKVGSACKDGAYLTHMAKIVHIFQGLYLLQRHHPILKPPLKQLKLKCIFQCIKAEYNTNQHAGGSSPTKGNRFIVFKDYTSRYRPGLEIILSNINLKITATEKVGIIGAGKSSLTLSLFWVIEPCSGMRSIDKTFPFPLSSS